MPLIVSKKPGISAEEERGGGEGKEEEEEEEVLSELEERDGVKETKGNANETAIKMTIIESERGLNKYESHEVVTTTSVVW
jgi:hypothetical protein